MSQWIRIPQSFPISRKSKSIADFVNSTRFQFSDALPSQLKGVPTTRRLAYICWRVNALERWLQLPTTEFQLRDRLTQSKFSLQTLPDAWQPKGDWYSDANLDELLKKVEYQFRQTPSGPGAHWAYVHELLDQVRKALVALNPSIWAEPPDGIGLGGAIFGGALVLLDDLGNRLISGWIGGGDLFDFVIRSTLYPATPTDTIGTDMLSWDYASGIVPPMPRFYLPAEQLAPGSDESSGYFERLRFRRGTTENAGRWPPDLQILSEFNLDQGQISAASHSLNCAWEELTSKDYGIFFQNRLRLMPPAGDQAPAQSYWVNQRGSSRYGPPPFFRTDSSPIPSTAARLWTKTYEFKLAASAVRNPRGQGGSSGELPRFNYQDNFTRIGFETDIQRNPWRRSWLDWISYLLGATPERVWALGSFSWDFILQVGALLPPTTTHVEAEIEYTAAAYWKWGDNDEQMCRDIIFGQLSGSQIAPEARQQALLHAFDNKPTGASNAFAQDQGTRGFSIDVTEMLRQNWGAWYTAVHLYPAIEPYKSLWHPNGFIDSLVSFTYSCAVEVGLEAEFPNGQRVPISFVTATGRRPPPPPPPP